MTENLQKMGEFYEMVRKGFGPGKAFGFFFTHKKMILSGLFFLRGFIGG